MEVEDFLDAVLSQRAISSTRGASRNEGLVEVIEAQSREVDLERTRLLEEIRG